MTNKSVAVLPSDRQPLRLVPGEPGELEFQEAPPAYDEVEASSSNSFASHAARSLRSARDLKHPDIDYSEAYPDVPPQIPLVTETPGFAARTTRHSPRTQDSHERRISSWIASVCDPWGWSACLYFIVVNIAFASFAFGWCLGTLIAGVVCLIFPPIGVFILLVSAQSWRMLGRMELILIEMCGPPYARGDRRNETLENHSTLFPPTFIDSYEFSFSPRVFLSYLTALLSDGFTVRCVFYFVTFKMAFSLIACVLACLLFGFSLVFMCFLPMCPFVCRSMGRAQTLMARQFLLGERAIAL